MKIAKGLQDDLLSLGVLQKRTDTKISQYDVMVTNSDLRTKTKKLFKDGHHARAVEEAYKFLDNLVKKKAGLDSTDLTGASLMTKVFSGNKPLLKLNEWQLSSEKTEQIGYMQIFAGCMTGIRNPLAHESNWAETEENALQLLSLANHLIEKTLKSKRADYLSNSS